MEDLTDALMGTIKKNNLYLKSGVADEMWKCVLERQPEPGVDGEATCTVKHSEPYGAMSPDIVKHFSGNPKFSKYFTYDYPTKRMALRAEYCRETAGFTDAMTQIMTVMRSLRRPGPFGSLRACEDIRMANGVSQEEYTLPVILASMLGVVTEEVGMNVYSETDDGKIMIRVNPVPIFSVEPDPELDAEIGPEADFFDDLAESGVCCPHLTTVSFGNFTHNRDLRIDRPVFGIARVFHLKGNGNIPNDKGDGFEWMTLEEVRTALVAREFTPAAELVMLDFLHRHDMLGISMSDEQKKVMEDALHPLKDMQQAFAGAFPDVSMIGNGSNS
ncbi:predicted protein [Chaetomium globosum CBS 148.51]|uniref:Uncharacterized protein n=1 Tax=Chaetomium globosum (strain ATCC 6205 / CBS 148.51 / DSM 1962 / NBRC 6347 / NRRL 1970) TaxID=306901 RepID=Q2HER3_CHAGB|nr:uncharacterized protein CHGG_01291 [Chaetomium globosum CBS 148.51]EAQ93056.1 predicted protein [Chaetomium globosum CBS 148.51]